MSYDNWNKYSLDDVCIKVTDGSHYSPKETGGKYPMLSVKDMKDNGFDYSSCKMIDEIQYKKLLDSDCVPQINDVLVAKDGSYMKHVFVTKEFKEEAVLSSIAILRPNLNKILPDFLKYYFLNPPMKNNIKENYVSGSAVPRIVLKDFKKMSLLIPDIVEQKAIANILSSLDDKIELNNKINKNLEELAQTLYKRWFVEFEFPNENGEPYKSSGGEMVESELGLIPKGWEVKELSEIASIIRGLSYKGKHLSDSGTKMINLGNIQPMGGFRYDKLKHYNGEYKERHIVHSGDLIIANTDMTSHREILGTPILVPLEFRLDCIFSHHLYAIKDTEISNYYLYYYFLSDQFKKMAENFANGTTVLSINIKDVKKTKVLIPNNTILTRFVNYSKNIKDKINTLFIESNKLSKVRDTLLPKLMNGEIEVPIEK